MSFTHRANPLPAGLFRVVMAKGLSVGLRWRCAASPSMRRGAGHPCGFLFCRHWSPLAAALIRSVLPALMLGLRAWALEGLSLKVFVGLFTSFEIYVANAVADADHCSLPS